MISHVARKLTLASTLALVLLITSPGGALAQTSTPTTPPTTSGPSTPAPDTVTGTDPEPVDDVILMTLIILQLA